MANLPKASKVFFRPCVPKVHTVSTACNALDNSSMYIESTCRRFKCNEATSRYVTGALVDTPRH